MTKIAPRMPDLQSVAAMLHEVISRYRSWPTTRQMNSNSLWHQARRNDTENQLEKRSPHWQYIPPDQKNIVVQQIEEIADVLGKVEGSQGGNLPNVTSNNTTHIYLRHGVTWRALGEFSDIDLVAVKKEPYSGYDEELIEAPVICGASRMWHIGYIGFNEIFRGNEDAALHTKLDVYRGACIFGDDFFDDCAPPPKLMWLCFVNYLMTQTLNYLFNVHDYPEDFWQAKAAMRAREVLEILKNIDPSLSGDDFIRIVKKGREFSLDEVMDYFDPKEQRIQELQKEALTIMWETYHHLGYSFDQK